MHSELNPCPFCGGEAEPYKQEEKDYFSLKLEKSFFLFGVGCWDCGCQVYGYDTEQEAINAWNQRETPIPDTPEMVRALDDAYEAGRKSAERTCNPIDEYFCGVPSCSNCGVTLNMEISGVKPFNKVLPHYCHNCGAKVVG